MIKYAIRVVTRNVFKDFKGTLENIVGRRIKTYELMISEAIKSGLEEIGEVKNHRVEISELSSGAMAVVVYGESE